MSTYKQMGYPPFVLENLGRLLFVFNGATTTSQGDVVLPVQAGPITLNIQFSVVEDLSSFNAIMGRAWLHRMKVIPSTYHQMVSYPTEDGQINLLSSQLVVCQCYQVEIDFRRLTSKKARPKPSNINEQQQLLNLAENDPMRLIHSNQCVSHMTHIKSPIVAHFSRQMNWNCSKACFNGTKTSSLGLILTCRESIHLWPLIGSTSYLAHVPSNRRFDASIRIGRKSSKQRLTSC